MSQRIRVLRHWWGAALAALALLAGGLAVAPPALAALGTVSAGGPYSGSEGSWVQIHGTASGATSFSWTAIRNPKGERDHASCTITGGGTLNPTVSCNDDGSFLVTLTAQDGSTSKSDTAKLTLKNVDPAATITTPAPGTAVAPHAVVSLSASYTDPGYVDSHHYTITWGDGQSSSAGNTEKQTGIGDITGSHSYAKAGSYTIKLTVFDSHQGSMGIDTTSVQVVSGKPCARVSGKGRLPHHRHGSSFAFSANCGSSGPVGRAAISLAHHGTLSSRRVTLLRGSGRSATWSGTGKFRASGHKVWRKNYRYTMTAVDHGRNTRKRHDYLKVVVRKPSGVVVLSAKGGIAGGNITVRN